MKILAVDTSTAKASVALCEDGKVLATANIEDGKTHSEKLVPMIAKVMSDCKISPRDVDYYAASVGPGSFTGLRIGVTTIKAMAMAVGKPCVPVPTLDALAYNCNDYGGIICPMIDARNNQVFTALYKSGERLTQFMAKPIEELLIDIKSASGTAGLKNIIFNGDAASKHLEFFKENLNNLTCEKAAEDKLLADSVSVAAIAFSMIEEGKVVSSYELVPEYLRKSSAEQNRDRGTGALSQ